MESEGVSAALPRVFPGPLSIFPGVTSPHIPAPRLRLIWGMVLLGQGFLGLVQVSCPLHLGL